MVLFEIDDYSCPKSVIIGFGTGYGGKKDSQFAYDYDMLCDRGYGYGYGYGDGDVAGPLKIPLYGDGIGDGQGKGI